MAVKIKCYKSNISLSNFYLELMHAIYRMKINLFYTLIVLINCKNHDKIEILISNISRGFRII